MRNESIQELFDCCEENLNYLLNIVKKSYTDPSIKSLVRPKVMDTLNSLNSILEYSHRDVFESLIKNERYIEFKKQRGEKIPNIDNKLNLPVCGTEISYVKFINRNHKYLKVIFPKIFEHLKTIHPFYAGENWFRDLKNLNNRNKHHDLSTQKRLDTKNLSIGRGGMLLGNISNMENVVIKNATIDGRRLSHLRVNKGEVDIHEKDDELEIVVSDTVRFFIDKVDVVQLIDFSILNVKQFTEQLYVLIRD